MFTCMMLHPLPIYFDSHALFVCWYRYWFLRVIYVLSYSVERLPCRNTLIHMYTTVAFHTERVAFEMYFIVAWRVFRLKYSCLSNNVPHELCSSECMCASIVVEHCWWNMQSCLVICLCFYCDAVQSINTDPISCSIHHLRSSSHHLSIVMCVAASFHSS